MGSQHNNYGREHLTHGGILTKEESATQKRNSTNVRVERPRAGVRVRWATMFGKGRCEAVQSGSGATLKGGGVCS